MPVFCKLITSSANDAQSAFWKASAASLIITSRKLTGRWLEGSSGIEAAGFCMFDFVK